MHQFNKKKVAFRTSNFHEKNVSKRNTRKLPKLYHTQTVKEREEGRYISLWTDNQRPKCGIGSEMKGMGSQGPASVLQVSLKGTHSPPDPFVGCV